MNKNNKDINVAVNIINLSVKRVARELIVALEGVGVGLIHNQAILEAPKDLCFI